METIRDELVTRLAESQTRELAKSYIVRGTKEHEVKGRLYIIEMVGNLKSHVRLAPER